MGGSRQRWLSPDGLAPSLNSLLRAGVLEGASAFTLSFLMGVEEREGGEG
jgi:hypothetical protein